MTRVFMVLTALHLGLAMAQVDPDDEWAQPPMNQVVPQPVREPLPTGVNSNPWPDDKINPSDAPPPVPPQMVGRKIRPPRPVEPPNTVSMAGAPTLGQWKHGEMLTLGFPFISLRVGLGITDGIDVGVGIDSMYFIMNEFRLFTRFRLLASDTWSLSGNFEAGAVLFGSPARREITGPRWISGRRNFNLSPALVVSYRASRPRASRLFAELRYTFAIDTEPFTTSPLEGVPGNFKLGHNAGIKAGAEMPLSPFTSFVFSFGVDVHSRPTDSPLMVNVSVGLTTSI